MKNKLISAAVLSGLLAVGGIGTAMAKPHFPLIHKHQTKMAQSVTMEQAQAAALKKVPGTVDDSKKETVKGKDMYWFAITSTSGQKDQVWVNMMGKVTKVKKEKMAKPMKDKMMKDKMAKPMKSKTS